MGPKWLAFILMIVEAYYAVDADIFKYEVSEKRQEATLHLGQTINLTCSLEKDAATKITWFKDGSKIVANVPRIKLSREVLTIRNVKFKDEGEYTCFPDEQTFHKTSEQKVTRSIHLHVERGKSGEGSKDNAGAEDDHDDDDHDAPAEDDPIEPFFTNFSNMHDTVAKTVGDNCTFSCQSYGIPTPTTRWFKDGIEIPSALERSILDLVSISKSDAGNYTCVISNTNGTIHHTTQLKVFDPFEEMPMILETPTDMNVSIGQDAIFDCKVSPKHKLSIQWIKHLDVESGQPDANNKSEDNSQVIVNDQRHRIHGDGKLIINNTQKEDEGRYSCIVQDFRGKAHSTFTLKISEVSKPSFIRADKMRKPCVKPAGSTLRLICNAKGVPTPKIKWLKNGQTPKRNLGTVKYGRWSLVLEDLVVNDSGNYTCEVCNHECISFTYRVMVQERFPHRPHIIESYLKNATVIVGSEVEFECKLLSDLEPHLTWVKVSEEWLNHYNLTDSEKIPNGTIVQQVLTVECVCHEENL